MNAADALFCGPLPEGFSRRVLRLAPGLELAVESRCLTDALVLVESGAVELECPSGASRCFGRGSMLPLARLPLARIRSVGRVPLVLVAVSRAARKGTDDFPNGSGSYCD
jgi:hypothetical protein